MLSPIASLLPNPPAQEHATNTHKNIFTRIAEHLLDQAYSLAIYPKKAAFPLVARSAPSDYISGMQHYAKQELVYFMACEAVSWNPALLSFSLSLSLTEPPVTVLRSDADAHTDSDSGSPTLLLFVGFGGVRGTNTRDRDVRLFNEVRVRFRPLSLLVIALGGRVVRGLTFCLRVGVGVAKSEQSESETSRSSSSFRIGFGFRSSPVTEILHFVILVELVDWIGLTIQ